MEESSLKRDLIQHLCCYKQWSKYAEADKHERTSSTFRLMFWFAVIQVTQCRGIIRYSHPHVNHKSSPKLFMALYFIYDYIFPCHLKVRKSRFCWQKQSCQAFHRDRAAFISHTGWESCGMWSSYSADKPYHLYIASIMLRSWIIFLYAKHSHCYLRKFVK